MEVEDGQEVDEEDELEEEQQEDSSLEHEDQYRLEEEDLPMRQICLSRFGNHHGKPIMPKLTDAMIAGDVAQFVTVGSAAFFKVTGLSNKFIHKPVSDWESDGDYLVAKKMVDQLKVVNDCAERGVQLAQECLGRAKSERKYQSIIQVVENNRKKNQNKRLKVK